MNTFRECMLDVETLSTAANAVVLSVGAVLFNLEDEDTYAILDSDLTRSFFVILDFQSQIDVGRSIDASTIIWWMQQNRMAQKEAFNEHRITLKDALPNLSAFIGDTCIWGNGANFDQPILRSLYYDFEVKFPTKFWSDRDLRTLAMLSPNATLPLRGVEHSSIEDARYQVLCAQEYYRGIQKQL